MNRCLKDLRSRSVLLVVVVAVAVRVVAGIVVVPLLSWLDPGVTGELLVDTVPSSGVACEEWWEQSLLLILLLLFFVAFAAAALDRRPPPPPPPPPSRNGEVTSLRVRDVAVGGGVGGGETGRGGGSRMTSMAALSS
jgi:hypothetical protein